MSPKQTLLVGMTGASGQIYGIKVLQHLAQTEVESSLILSRASKLNIENEEDFSVQEVQNLADHVYEYKSSNTPGMMEKNGFCGMLITPCSMKTLGSVAIGTTDNLITRCADRTLRNRKTLVLMPREKPFDRVHLQNMLHVHDAGGVIMPPFLSFYTGIRTFDGLIDRTVQRTLMLFDLPLSIEEWKGVREQIRSRKQE